MRAVSCVTSSLSGLSNARNIVPVGSNRLTTYSVRISASVDRRGQMVRFMYAGEAADALARLASFNFQSGSGMPAAR